MSDWGTTKLLLIYFIGFGASIYIGMRIEWYLRRKQRKHERHKAFERGFRAGQGFVDRVKEEQLNFDSAIKILTGSEIYTREE